MVSLASSERVISDVIATGVGGGLKRKHTGSDFEDAFPSSQTKRQKVAFDPDVEVRILEDWNERNEKGLELVREEVRRGLEKHVAGDSTGYDQLKHLLTAKPSSDDAPSTSLLRKYIVVLNSHVGLLNNKCSGLVHAILDCNWLVRDESFVGSYIRLLGSLISAHGGYTGPVLQMLVNSFVECGYFKPSRNTRR